MTTAAHGGLAPSRQELPNGAAIIAKESRMTPAVTLMAALRAGGQHDPDDRLGLAHFLSKTLDRGTGNRSADQIARDLDNRGVTLDVSATRHVLSVSCTCLAEDFEAMLALLGDIVRNPVFPEDEIETRRGEIVTSIRQDEDSPAVMALETLRNSAFSAFLVGQQAARLMLGNEPDANGARGTIIFTNASAALKGFPSSGAFAMACHAKSGLAQSMARELMPQGIHVANVPIDAAIGWTQEDGTRAHRLAGTTVDDNMADPDHIAKTYLHLHRQHRSTWAFEVVLRPWAEKW